jgi:hypothetical protein
VVLEGLIQDFKSEIAGDVPEGRHVANGLLG